MLNKFAKLLAGAALAGTPLALASISLAQAPAPQPALLAPLVPPAHVVDLIDWLGIRMDPKWLSPAYLPQGLQDLSGKDIFPVGWHFGFDIPAFIIVLLLMRRPDNERHLSGGVAQAGGNG